MTRNPILSSSRCSPGSINSTPPSTLPATSRGVATFRRPEQSPTEQDPPAGLSRREKHLAFAGVLTCLFLSSLNLTVVGTALPRIIAELQGFHVYAWAFTGFSLALTASLPVYGRLSDIHGRKTILLIGIVIVTLSSVLSGLAQNMPQLIAFSIAQGQFGSVRAGSEPSASRQSLQTARGSVPSAAPSAETIIHTSGTTVAARSAAVVGRSWSATKLPRVKTIARLKFSSIIGPRMKPMRGGPRVAAVDGEPAARSSLPGAVANSARHHLHFLPLSINLYKYREFMTS
ncbi:MAG: MFS transporter [Trueperaceae bacterium]